MQFEKISDSEILGFYLNKIGKNLIVDTYFLKGFFIQPEILNIMNDS